METPYFLPTDPILFAMRTAALSGVDVRLMVPYETDTKIVEWASRTYVLATVKAGVKVYLYKAGFNHQNSLLPMIVWLLSVLLTSISVAWKWLWGKRLLLWQGDSAASESYLPKGSRGECCSGGCTKPYAPFLPTAFVGINSKTLESTIIKVRNLKAFFMIQEKETLNLCG